MIKLIKKAWKKNNIQYYWGECDCGIGIIITENSEMKHCGLCTHSNAKDLTGQRFGRLTVLNRTTNGPNGAPRWRCICDCGNVVDVRADALKRPNASCGCVSNEIRKVKSTKHGYVGTPFWSIWKGMKNRCNNPKSAEYHNYGGRGIRVCDRWEKNIANFVADMKDGYAPGLQLDRIDVNGDYEKENCRWVTPKENSNNKRNNHKVPSIYGEMNVTELAEFTKVSPTTLEGRIERDTPTALLTLPASKIFKYKWMKMLMSDGRILLGDIQNSVKLLGESVDANGVVFTQVTDAQKLDLPAAPVRFGSIESYLDRKLEEKGILVDDIRQCKKVGEKTIITKQQRQAMLIMLECLNLQVWSVLNFGVAPDGYVVDGWKVA